MLHTCTHTCRGHADLFCVVPALTDDPRMESAVYAVYAGQLHVKCKIKPRKKQREKLVSMWMLSHASDQLRINGKLSGKYNIQPICHAWLPQNFFTRICTRGHADILSFVPSLMDDPRRESAMYAVYARQPSVCLPVCLELFFCLWD